MYRMWDAIRRLPVLFWSCFGLLCAWGCMVLQCLRFVDRDMLMRYVDGGVGHFKQGIGETGVTVEDATGK